MRANEFLNEAKLGVAQKRAVREGSRPARGHKPQECYNMDEEFELDEAGKASKKLCLSKKTDKELGASQLSSCQAQGIRKRKSKNKRKFRIGGKLISIDGKKVKSNQYGGPIPTWNGN